MKTEELQDILAWIKGTDLVEVSYKRDGRGFTFALPGAPSQHPAYFPGPKLVPVASQWVGLFQWSKPGQAKPFKEGDEVEACAELGMVDTGLKKNAPVTAPCAGRLSRVLVDGGDAVQYGQPLFFIEPASR